MYSVLIGRFWNTNRKLVLECFRTVRIDIYRIMAVLKVETDIIVTCSISASLIGRAVILVIVH